MSAPPPVTSGSTRACLSVVIPCYNHEGHIDAMCREVIEALSWVDDLEILLVDDGSSDATLAEIRAEAQHDARVKYLSFTRNFGLEAAQAAGFQYASKPWTVQLDQDLQKPPSEIHKLLAAAAEGYDVVFGTPAHRHDPLVRRWGSRLQRWVATSVFGVAIPPRGATTFRVVRTGVARRIVALRLGTPYFIAMVPMVGARYACVPTEHRADSGRSHWRATRLVGHSFELFFGYSWRPVNGAYLGAALAVVASLFGAVLALGGGLAGPVRDALALLLAGGGLATMAITLRYLYRHMTDERHSRPYYVRESNLPLRPEDRLDGEEGWQAPPLPPAHVEPERSVLILGASEDQVPVYREFRERGYRTIGVDWWTDRPAMPWCDEFLHLSTRDHAAIRSALAGRRPAAVVAAASDVSLESWHVLTQAFDTPFRYPAAVAGYSVDKPAFHEASARAGLPVYPHRSSTECAELVAFADDLGYPVVAKPSDACGSRGVTLAHDRDELVDAIAEARRHSDAPVLVEQFLPGVDVTVDCFLLEGRVAFCAMTEKRIVPGPRFLIGGHTMPARIGEDLRARLVERAEAVCAAIGMTDGPVNVDMIVGDDGTVHVLEPNARLCGNGMPLLVNEVYGVDTVGALASLCLGEPVDLVPSVPRAGIMHLLVSPLVSAGRLVEVGDLEAVRRLPGVVRCELFAAVGDVVYPFTQAGHKFGMLMVSGDTHEEAEETLRAALGRLTLRVEPDASLAGVTERPQGARPETAPASTTSPPPPPSTVDPTPDGTDAPHAPAAQKGQDLVHH